MSAYTPEVAIDLEQRAATASIRTRTRDVFGMRYLEPQAVFDLLPSQIQEDIDLAHFKAVLHASHALFVELQHRQVARNAAEHLLHIEQVTK